jgi:hypothetical protein
MAEIKIEKKSPIWPWVLVALLVIGALIYFIFFRETGGEREQITDTPTEETRDPDSNNTSPVSAYVAFIHSGTDQQMTLDHEFTNEALLKLTNATEAMADKVGYNGGKEIQDVRDYANKITQDPFETTHADNIRRSADILSNVLQNIQQSEFQSLSNEAADVKKAAESIDPDTLTLDQRDAVKAFFDKAATLLEKMNNG